ncbi:hypothetical protein QBC46DRAFT_162323 [Diplogelasinospora grovesii]|uniref:Uncharacterized protein n=1 Tax=Diplogelasinospora grovesii TaxID=303347 RepID=A0AAN6N704_9PEZI|nr:hypothetical protein QBC46DRAFT_162323 [Diplogelasinospora grovesii]
MSRTMRTALVGFCDVLFESGPTPQRTKVYVWPDLRETHDFAICNQGIAKQELKDKFECEFDWDMSECHKEWDYPPFTTDEAVARAERVRLRLKQLSDSAPETCENIFLVTHRGFISFLVQGERFDSCECRSYRFATEQQVNEETRYGINPDSGLRQDYGPTVLLPASPVQLETKTNSVT